MTPPPVAAVPELRENVCARAGWTVRAWRIGDEAPLLDAARSASVHTLVARFDGAVTDLSISYLPLIRRNWPLTWNAVVALDVDGCLIGWADYGRRAPEDSDAEVAICVIDAARRRGVGLDLAVALDRLALRNGIVTAHARVRGDNVTARRFVAAVRRRTLVDLTVMRA